MTIVMYGEDWCGDCKRAKAFFAEHGIDHRWIDLEERPEFVPTARALNGGEKRIPVIVTEDATVLVEPSDAELAAMFAAHDLVELDSRFELRRNGELLSFASVRAEGDNVVVPHVETVPEHRGRGNADRLMDLLLDRLDETGRTITPLCPFAADHIRNRPHRQSLVA